MERIAGTIFLKVNGAIQRAKGDFTYDLGLPGAEEMLGADGQVQGYIDKHRAPFIEGELTDSLNLDVAALASINDSTIELQLANGKTILLREGKSAMGAGGSTAEGAIPVKFFGQSGEEVK